MSFKLVRPLVFFDLETTGLDILTDRIVEMSFVKLHPDGRREEKTKRVNPGIHISEASTEIHHITDDDVKNEPSFSQYAKSLASWLKGCDLAGFNSNHFDIPLLVQEFDRAGVDFSIDGVHLVDVFNIYRLKERRNLETAYRFYCGKELNDAHQASADITATIEVLQAQTEMYEDLNGMSVKSLSEFASPGMVDPGGRIVRNNDGVPVFNFGKYKGMPVAEVFEMDRSYYGWIMEGKFEKAVKDVVTRIHLGVFK